MTAKEYAGKVKRISNECGNLTWAAPQDWMCEPFMIEKTGLSVKEHQRLTTENFLELRSLGCESVIPVLQGFAKQDYLEHLDQYDRYGIRLSQEPIVGVGSVCRRQGTLEALAIFRSLYVQNISMHGFGVKMNGLKLYKDLLVSSDSRWHGRSPPGGRKFSFLATRTSTAPIALNSLYCGEKNS